MGIALQYGLSGSGSCVYTRSLAEALARAGHEVHVLSFERQPETYPLFRRAWRYPLTGPRQEIPLPSAASNATCTSHDIEMPLYPVAYPRVTDEGRAPLFLELSDADLERHMERLVEVYADVAAREGLEALCVNHEVVLPEVARRLAEATGLRYVVVVHGSTLEYVVRRQDRYHRLAEQGLGGADRVVVLNADVRRRVLAVHPGLVDRLAELPVGVDPDLFRPVPRGERRLAAAAAVERFAAVEEWDGMGPRVQARLRDVGASCPSYRKLASVVRRAQGSYRATAVDQALGARLRQIDWERDPVVAYVGKLLVDKGVHCLLAAAPLVAKAVPRVRFLIIGSGVFREGLEVMQGALDAPPGARPARVDQLERLARACDPGCGGLSHLEGLTRPATGSVSDRVIFTGYLTTRRLARLLPLARVSVVPSLIPEAFPLVVLEAAACGVVPLGTDLGGLRCALDAVSDGLRPILDTLHVDPAPGRMVAELAERIVDTLRRLEDPGRRWAVREALRQRAVQAFSWDGLARRLAALLERAAHPTVRADA